MKKKLFTTLLAATIATTACFTAFAQTSYEHIRNATGKLTYNDTTFLIDPFFAPKDSHPGFPDTFNQNQTMPLVDLPKSIDDIVANVDAVIVTHTHLDHWDDVAAKSIDKNLPIYVQHEADKQLIQNQGFKDVRVLSESANFNGVTITKRTGSHGTEEMYAIKALGDALGEAMGVVFTMPNEKTTYLMGDTIWTPEINKNLSKYNPDVLIMNTGYAQMIGFDDAIIMGTEDVGKAARLAPKAKIITVHMDTVNHTATSRADMRKYVNGQELTEQVSIPEDGETITL